MGHKNKKSLVRQVQENLQEKLNRGVGTSKHLDKQTGSTGEKIYSFSTFQSYLKHNIQFANYCKENYGCKTLADCRSHVDDYLHHRMSYCSSWTVKLDAASIGKLYGESTTAFCHTNSRLRTDVVRSRGEKGMDRHFSEVRNSQLVEFCRSTGLRRSEVAACRGSHLVKVDTPAGSSFHGVGIFVPNGKNGKSRIAPLCCSKEVADRIIQQCKEAGDGKLFERVHSAADIHSFRSEYSSNFYRAICPKDKNSIPPKNRYICRGSDKAGVVYSRPHLRQVSAALGHNRECVVANSYLHDLK